LCFFFFSFFITRKCDKNQDEKKKKNFPTIRPMVWMLFILI
jgi:hypothetical protein